VCRFDQEAKTLKRRELCRKYQVTCCIVIAIVIAIAVVVIVLVGPSATGGLASNPAPPGSTPAPTQPPF
jgi:hypothetical protein